MSVVSSYSAGLITSSPYKSPSKKQRTSHGRKKQFSPGRGQLVLDTFFSSTSTVSEEDGVVVERTVTETVTRTKTEVVEASPRSKGLLTTLFSPFYTLFSEQAPTKLSESLERAEDVEVGSVDDDFFTQVSAETHTPKRPSLASPPVDGPPLPSIFDSPDNLLSYMRGLPPVIDVRRGQEKGVLLPRKNCKRPTLVLDLDETLVHCTTGYMDNPEFRFSVELHGTVYTVSVKKRPYCEHFLTRVSQLFEVVVFTASQKVYADRLLDIMDPKRKWIHHRLFRDSCLCVNGSYIKDLHSLGRDLANTFIVDNSPLAFAFHLDNGVPIESFFEDTSDRELLNMLPFIENLASVEDVRPIIRNQFQLQPLVEQSK
eukprot:Rmarinus@m.1488